MKFLFGFAFLLFIQLCHAQLYDSLILGESSSLKTLEMGDSLIYYQCHVEAVGIKMSTAGGQTLSSNPQKCSITEKFVVLKTPKCFLVRHYTSSLTNLPNRKFSGLKIKERAYWNFTFNKELPLTESALKYLMAIEKKGREAIEFDYVISKYTTNQIIIKHKKNFRQLVIEGDYVISRFLFNQL